MILFLILNRKHDKNGLIIETHTILIKQALFFKILHIVKNANEYLSKSRKGT